MKKNQRNQDLRDQIKSSNLYLWQIAEQLNIHENTLYRLLRYELSNQQKTQISSAIKQLKSKQ
ncbi:hypothetical protein [Halalkalibacter sp. APA_J-10(15)]|uniref:hypothetical protein n=1 Tax=Halalkalibacter sp. APA_J-10(15) TaxID=2933805 RepID=UPI001FF45287|nr:hypothetical protein [Halalkalibacter sp. APA_J-10(15)]MCK0473911.1 hypothetical protein [Halalkalibacter sp. APA_J-10(15)]